MIWFQDEEEAASAFEKWGLNVTPDAIYAASLAACLEFPISEGDLRAKIEPCLRRLLRPKDAEASEAKVPASVNSWAAAIKQSFGDAERRCRRNKATAQQARRDLFTYPIPPFSNIDEGRRWIASQRQQMGAPHVHHYEADGEEAWWMETLAWPGENLGVARCPVDKDGPLARLAKWSKLLADQASVMEAQATAYILCGSIVAAESPIRTGIIFHKERSPVVQIEADAHVPQKLVTGALAKMRAKAVPSQKRARPGRR